VLGEYGGQLPAVVLYSANLTGVVLIGQWMRWDAHRAGLTERDEMTGREDLVSSIFIAGVFLLSIVVALWDASIAPFTWFLLFIEGRGHFVKRFTHRIWG
jgi:hypothetical protein